MNNSPDNKLIVALDVQTAREARELFTLLRGVACMFKIGSQLFTSAGPQIVREIVEAGGRVFLDLKFHDIPNTVAAAGVEAARLGVSIFNVHAAGGSLMMHRTVEAVANVAAREGLKRPSVIAVTVLTSADDDALAEVGVSSGALGQVVRLARLAAACGLDGVVASPHEVSTIRAQVLQQDFLIVTPIASLYRLTQGKLAIIGVGGIFNAEDAWEKISAGASLVQLYTGFIYEGPSVVRDINDGLSKILSEQGFRTLDEAVGCRAVELAGI